MPHTGARRKRAGIHRGSTVFVMKLSGNRHQLVAPARVTAFEGPLAIVVGCRTATRQELAETEYTIRRWKLERLPDERQ